MLGLSIGSRDSIEQTAEFVKYIRNNMKIVPPVVLSGNVVERLGDATSLTGADFVVSTAKDAIERCGLETAADQQRRKVEA